MTAQLEDRIRTGICIVRRVIDELTQCVLCGAKEISAMVHGSTASVTCHACGAMFDVEHNPPDRPELRARIEVINRRVTSRPGAPMGSARAEMDTE